STERGKRSARRGWVCARRGRMACGTGATATAASDKWLSGPVAAWCDGPGEKRPPLGVPLPLATLAPAAPPAKIVRQTGNFMCYPCVRTPVTLVSGQNTVRTAWGAPTRRTHQKIEPPASPQQFPARCSPALAACASAGTGWKTSSSFDERQYGRRCAKRGLENAIFPW